MASLKSMKNRKASVQEIEDPPFARALFGEVKWAWLWLLARLYLGYQWIHAGWGKIHNPAWVGSNAGSALAGFVKSALTKASGQNPDVQGWYAWFLEHVVTPHTPFWSNLVAFGEFLVGIALLLGIFTGITALFSLFMSMNYLLAGSVSINPIMLILAIGVVLAWKIAGWWGFDRWLLPLLGTPWSPGYIFQKRTKACPPKPCTILPED
jgi:thiosulfate dehydrogenase [quinone] large subunit